jgi:NADPH:quinone reductase-like Zn-dependent oxidoreductase
VLGTVRGDALEKSLRILKPKSTVVSLIGPPDAAFGRGRGMNVFMVFVFWLLSRKIIRHAKRRDVKYSFLFVHPDGGQLAEIGELLKAGRIRPVIDKDFRSNTRKRRLRISRRGEPRERSLSGCGNGADADVVLEAATAANPNSGTQPVPSRAICGCTQVCSSSYGGRLGSG